MMLLSVRRQHIVTQVDVLLSDGTRTQTTDSPCVFQMSTSCSIGSPF